jgi:IPT/TIG domain-containing protein
MSHSLARITVFAQATAQTPGIVVSDWFTWLVGAMVILVLLTPMILRGRDREFFKIPFITWYLLQYGIAALVILVVLILALTAKLTPEGVTGILGSLIGYVLGSTSRRAQDASDQLSINRHITAVAPNAGAAGAPVTISGVGFGGSPGTVTFGNAQAVVTNWADAAIQTTVPNGLAPGPVRIAVQPANANYQLLTSADAFKVQ